MEHQLTTEFTHLCAAAVRPFGASLMDVISPLSARLQIPYEQDTTVKPECEFIIYI
jgi:hypothetical protein